MIFLSFFENLKLPLSNHHSVLKILKMSHFEFLSLNWHFYFSFGYLNFRAKITWQIGSLGILSNWDFFKWFSSTVLLWYSLPLKTISVIISNLCSLRGRHQLLVDNKGGHTIMKVLLLLVTFFVCVISSEESIKKADPSR